MQHHTAFLLLFTTLTTLASASTISTTASRPVITVFFPNLDPQTLDASIITANPSQTIAVVGCPSTTLTSAHTTATLPPDQNECGVPSPITVTAGPSTFGGSYAVPGTSSVTYVVDCAITARTDVTCTAGYTDAVHKTQSLSTSVLEASEVSAGYQPITVTGGADKLASATATATSSGSMSGSGSGSGSAAKGAAATVGPYRRAGWAGAAVLAAAQLVV